MDLVQSYIRNFAIIAHIDHGKSTLADRLLEMTGTVLMRNMHAQLLDSNPIERERGITIKLAPVRMKHKIGEEEYIFNLIDTPGHVDFGYEVSRSLAACEGAVLVVDATQGVQAQTLANLHQARTHKLTIIPVINKIDLPNARISEAEEELVALGFAAEEILKISAKTGENVGALLAALAQRIPPPQGNANASLRALVFSSHYDSHRGVVVFVRVVDGSIRFDASLRLKFLASGVDITPVEVGYFMPEMRVGEVLQTGEVGYIATGLKDAKLAQVGDTIVRAGDPEVVALPGYRAPKPMVFLSLFPVASNEFSEAREAMEKLRLSDSAFTFRPIASQALGNGFHCGFLGLLHAEVVQERILREFNLTMIATAPSVEYRLKLKGAKGGKVDAQGYTTIQSAAEFPDPTFIEEVREPMMQVELYTPKAYVGAVMQLGEEKRGEYTDMVYEAETAHLTYLMPLSEMIIDFFDRLKSVTAGYASLDYTFFDWVSVKVAKLDILLNHERVDALAFLAVESEAEARGREIVEKLSSVIPRQQFGIPVQAAIGGRIVARADVKPFRKDVIQKLYGGDRTRKDKLLSKQKKGKAKMKMIGRVEIPQSAFFEVLKRE
jgi:GTP-binding protein LepA